MSPAFPRNRSMLGAAALPYAAVLALACVAAAAAAAAAGSTEGPEWAFEKFVAAHRRAYRSGSPEYTLRKKIFEGTLREVKEHNENGTHTWRRGINEFADMTLEEFETSGKKGYDRVMARHSASFNWSKAWEQSTGVSHGSEKHDRLDWPASLDWRDQGVVTPVKDQGDCGSCWAFATTENVESYAAMASDKLEVLSPQQLVTCAPNPLDCGGTGGCEGSIPEVAYQYVQLFGLTAESTLPYAAGKYSLDPLADVCNVNAIPAVVSISGYMRLPPNNYRAVMKALTYTGPLTVVVATDRWIHYSSGVYDGCTNYIIDHAVQLIGYGSDSGKGGGYWLLRNSWGTRWGEKGFMRLRREELSACGIDSDTLVGTGCRGGPPTQQVCGACGILFDVSYPLGAVRVDVAAAGGVVATVPPGRRAEAVFV